MVPALHSLLSYSHCRSTSAPAETKNFSFQAEKYSVPFAMLQQEKGTFKIEDFISRYSIPSPSPALPPLSPTAGLLEQSPQLVPACL